MIAAFGPAAIAVASVALASLIGGFVLMRLVNGYLVDQTVNAAEAALLLLLTAAVIGSVILNWGHPTMVIGPLLGTVTTVGWGLFLRKHDQRCEAAHMSAQEERAWKMLERDPSATVALEQLANIMEREGRFESLLGVLEQWQGQEPGNKTVQRRIRETRARLGLDDVAEPQAETLLDA